jgi:uncharacterized protein YegL
MPGDYCPLVLVIIDGVPGDDWEAAARILFQHHKIGVMLLCGAGRRFPLSNWRRLFLELLGLSLTIFNQTLSNHSLSDLIRILAAEVSIENESRLSD